MLKNIIIDTPWITKNEHVLQRAARDPQQEESDLERDEFCPEAPAPSNDKEICPGGGRWKMEDGRWKMEDGRWKMEDGRDTTEPQEVKNERGDCSIRVFSGVNRNLSWINTQATTRSMRTRLCTVLTRIEVRQ
jgi:hypothetical protein